MTEFVLQNTSWEWWIRPKTVYCNGRMWLGGMGDDGSVRVDVIADDGTCRRAVVTTFGVVGGTPTTGADDHNSSAILAIPGKVPIVFYQKHGSETKTYYNRGTMNADDGYRFLSAQSQLNWNGIASAIGVTYPHVFNVGDEVHIFTRVTVTGQSSRYYGYARSSDWAQTWDVSPVLILDNGFAQQTYPAMQNVNGIMRIGIGVDPDGGNDHDVYYCEMDLATGKIYKPEDPSTSLGNAQTGVGLPVLRTGTSLVRTAPAGIRSNYFDTSGGTVPRCSWVEYDETDTQGTATYYVGSYVSGAWVVHPVCSAGQEFGQSVSGRGGYMGGCHFTNEDPDALDVLVSRNHGGDWRAGAGSWTIERWHSDDHGATWDTPTVIASDTFPLVRPFQIEGAGAFKAVYERITRYGVSNGDLNGFNDWKADLIVTDQ